MHSEGPGAATSNGRQPSLLGSVLSGLLARPAVRDELGELTQTPATLEFVDDVGQVWVRVDSQDQATVDQREGCGQALTATHRAGEQKPTTCHGERPDPSLGPAIVDFESAILETALEEGALVDGTCSPAPQPLSDTCGLRRIRGQIS